MGLLLHCFMALSIVTLTTGFVTQPVSKPSGQTVFVMKSNLSLPSPNHRIQRRSAGQGASCSANQGSLSTLTDNTRSFTFFDQSRTAQMDWIGEGTGIMLVLTTYKVPYFVMKYWQSRLYRSENYGKSFRDITQLINNTFIRSEFGINVSPDNSGKVILTAEVSGQPVTRIFVSDDFGRSFSSHVLPFNPQTPIDYNPENSTVLAVISNNNELWLSDDFGMAWRKIHDSVCFMTWGRNNTLYFTSSYMKSCKARGMLDLKKTTDFGKTLKLIAMKIYSFVARGRFLFATVMKNMSTLRKMHVSVDQGETWSIAQLPAVSNAQFYSILAASEDVVFIHVDEPGDSGYGTVYVSDDRGTVYSKSLERHVYTTGGYTDFTNITSLRGVFITSVLSKDNYLQSVVSFDQGGEWVPLRKPVNSSCDFTAKDPQNCSLHIHAAYSTSVQSPVPMLPLSEPNAVGLILAHGSVGDAFSVLRPDVYASDDGGYTWFKALDGPHHYVIMDSGGLLVAVEDKSYLPIKSVKFSTDEGQCWRTYNFTSYPMYFSGVSYEPGARSMNVSIWGYRWTWYSVYWIIFTIDFKQFLTRECGDQDYVKWMAHSNDISDPNDGCMLGYKETFTRLKKDTVCWNGRDYAVKTLPTSCPCTLDDFLCDFGYYRNENSSECVEEPELKGKVLELCLHGKKEQLVTSGYRKIPGDKCEGGQMPERKEIDLSEACVSDLLGPELQRDSQDSPHSSKAASIAITIIILVLGIVGGVWLVKKYVYRGRFLPRRYSVMQEAAEVNTMDDPLESGIYSKIEFRNDSDEDLLD